VCYKPQYTFTKGGISGSELQVKMSVADCGQTVTDCGLAGSEKLNADHGWPRTTFPSSKMAQHVHIDAGQCHVGLSVVSVFGAMRQRDAAPQCLLRRDRWRRRQHSTWCRLLSPAANDRETGMCRHRLPHDLVHWGLRRGSPIYLLTFCIRSCVP